MPGRSLAIGKVIALTTALITVLLISSVTQAKLRSFVLSSNPEGTGSIYVDDDLKVMVDDSIYLNDVDEDDGTLPPVSFSADDGAVLKIEAKNIADPAETDDGDLDHDGHYAITPLYLYDKEYNRSFLIFGGIRRNESAYHGGSTFLKIEYTVGTPLKAYCISSDPHQCKPIYVDEDLWTLEVHADGLDIVAEYDRDGEPDSWSPVIPLVAGKENQVRIVVANAKKDGRTTPMYLVPVDGTGDYYDILPNGASGTGPCRKWRGNCHYPENVDPAIIADVTITVDLSSEIAQDYTFKLESETGNMPYGGEKAIHIKFKSIYHEPHGFFFAASDGDRLLFLCDDGWYHTQPCILTLPDDIDGYMPAFEKYCYTLDDCFEKAMVVGEYKWYLADPQKLNKVDTLAYSVAADDGNTGGTVASLARSKIEEKDLGRSLAGAVQLVIPGKAGVVSAYGYLSEGTTTPPEGYKRIQVGHSEQSDGNNTITTDQYCYFGIAKSEKVAPDGLFVMYTSTLSGYMGFFVHFFCISKTVTETDNGTYTNYELIEPPRQVYAELNGVYNGQRFSIKSSRVVSSYGNNYVFIGMPFVGDNIPYSLEVTAGIGLGKLELATVSGRVKRIPVYIDTSDAEGALTVEPQPEPDAPFYVFKIDFDVPIETVEASRNEVVDDIKGYVYLSVDDKFASTYEMDCDAHSSDGLIHCKASTAVPSDMFSNGTFKYRYLIVYKDPVTGRASAIPGAITGKEFTVYLPVMNGVIVMISGNDEPDPLTRTMDFHVDIKAVSPAAVGKSYDIYLGVYKKARNSIVWLTNPFGTGLVQTTTSVAPYYTGVVVDSDGYSFDVHISIPDKNDFWFPLYSGEYAIVVGVVPETEIVGTSPILIGEAEQEQEIDLTNADVFTKEFYVR